MKVDFHSPARKRLVAACVAVLAFFYFALAALNFAASWLGSRPEIRSLKLAARLDPGNADYRNHIGRYYDLVVHDAVSAIEPYKQAVLLNPHSARYWFD